MDKVTVSTKKKKMSGALPEEASVFRSIGTYAKANNRAAILEVCKTVPLVLLAYYLAWVFADQLVWVFLAAVLFGLCRVRLFIIFHDCIHDSFFTKSIYNRVLGTLLGGFVLTAFGDWRKSHLYHHKNANDQENTEAMEHQTAPWNRQQFFSASLPSKIMYCLIYGPVTYVCLIPLINYYVLMRQRSTILENSLVVCYLSFLSWLMQWHWSSIILFEVVSAMVGGGLGFALFHVQHTFDGISRGKISFYENGMLGSSYLKVPFPLSFFTLGIEFHHIHHLNTKVPSYRLAEGQAANEKLFACVPTFPFHTLFSSCNLNVYNPETKRFESCYRLLWNEITKNK